MKKFLKIFLITFVCLFIVLSAVLGMVVWKVFTPDKLTPMVRNQAGKFINCQTDIGEVELTFFSTFPRFGLKINRLALINPKTDAPCDTLMVVDHLIGTIDASAWWNNKELILNNLILTNGTVKAFTDSLGTTNFDVLLLDTVSSTTTDESQAMFNFIDVENIELKNINLSYVDHSIGLKSEIRNLSANIIGKIKPDSITGHITISQSIVSLEHDGTTYLNDASVQLNFPTNIVVSRQFIELNDVWASMNDLSINLNGTIENDTINRNMMVDMGYKFKSWQLKNLLALVPPSFHAYLKGMDIDGVISSEGTIRGTYNDSSMPLLDIQVILEKGRFKYDEFPIPFNEMNGNIAIRSDFKTDSLSIVRINRFKAKTPQSSFEVDGTVKHLFSDIQCNLSTNANLALSEFNPIIPADMKTVMRGNVRGKYKTSFTMSQVEKLQLERMKLSGSATLSNLDVTYDSLSLTTNASEIEFSLPNHKASTKETSFAYIKIGAQQLSTGKLERYNALLQNAHLTLETSDFRDTKAMPELIFTFMMDSLSANMDTMSVAIAKPYGKMSVSPQFKSSKEPTIHLSYNSNHFRTNIGQNSANIERLSLDADIVNDNTQKDAFLQWLAKGFIDLEEGEIVVANLSHPIEIPAIKMTFEPEKLNIQESKFKIDQSDFELTGKLTNVLSYFRNDSILKGNFNFTSENTDILYFMKLTNGINNEEESGAHPETHSDNSTADGPYMVPKGMEVLLHANVRTATYGADSIFNIIGNIGINDGILLLDEVTCETSAAKMQLTAMYRTPRKNHLFLGLDYHMLDVEIDALLKMIPDIDTLMPMLRSFGGRGEFHIAVETYLDSMYNVKKSTLRGASSIKGQDLVLMDGETFGEIAKTLRFNKKTENRVDSLSAEFTIFKEEIDVYPFLLVMDKYKAVVVGRHNFDLTFDYHISVVECPLPIKLGIDVKGNMDDLSYRLAKCRYADFYRPASRRVVENRQLELRKMIRESITRRLIE